MNLWLMIFRINFHVNKHIFIVKIVKKKSKTIIYFKRVMSSHGLITTVAYKLGKDEPAYYALEGKYIFDSKKSFSPIKSYLKYIFKIEFKVLLPLPVPHSNG